jgi:hypothetical protein
MFCAEQNRTGVGIPTGAISFSMSGNVFVLGSAVFGYADVATADNANVLVASYGGRPSSATANVDMGVALAIDVTA